MKRRKGDKKDDKTENDKQAKHPGGPLQRTGASADSWNEAVGSSLDNIPFGLLPTNRTILRRYRCLRMNNENSSTNELIAIIVEEVLYHWNCSRVPTCSRKRCHDHVSQLIEWWNESSKNPSQYRLHDNFQRKLDELFDIASKPKGRYNEEKALRSIIFMVL